VINGILINIWFLICFFCLVAAPKVDREEIELIQKKREIIKAMQKVFKEKERS